MEYSFQNGVREKKSTITLNEFDLVIESGAEWLKIAYPQITEVRLSRRKNLYSIHVTSLDTDVIEITNSAYDSQGKWIDQSRHYQTFVRVLHLHLQNKCKASFYSGASRFFHSMYLGVAAIIGLAAFVLEEYFDVTPVSGIMLSSGIFVCLGLLLVLPRVAQWQREYSPSEVPMSMLPPA
jgi:hypothetical protein